MLEKKLKALGMYYNRPADELIFLTESEHRTLHNKGKSLSEETRNKMSESRKGKHPSKETKKKLSEAKKGKPKSEEIKKKMSEAQKGKHASKETKKKMSLQRTGRHWYNNGKENKFCYECPDGFIPGLLRK